MIEFKNVTKIYNTGTEAVHNASFTIEKGEFAKEILLLMEKILLF